MSHMSFQHHMCRLSHLLTIWQWHRLMVDRQIDRPGGWAGGPTTGPAPRFRLLDLAIDGVVRSSRRSPLRENSPTGSLKVGFETPDSVQRLGTKQAVWKAQRPLRPRTSLRTCYVPSILSFPKQSGQHVASPNLSGSCPISPPKRCTKPG